MAPNNNKKKKNKSNKKKRNKNKKACGDDGGGTDGNNNNNQDNSTIPTTVATATAVAAVTTTPLVTTELINNTDKAFGLTAYPKSTHYGVGVYQHFVANTTDLAIASFIRGAKNDGCVGCMFFLGYLHHESNNNHLLLPWALECSIRGHIKSMTVLINQCYEETKPVPAPALSSFWVKTMIELDDTHCTEEKRKEVKKNAANVCFGCGETDTVDKIFEKCSICKYYSYCCKDHQRKHWKEGNHMGECRQLKILHTYYKPRHVEEIREAIIDGDDPKEIPRLQNLRTALGLNRPKEEYEELVLRLGDSDDITIQARYKYLTARKDGTVHIGSTPEAM